MLCERCIIDAVCHVKWYEVWAYRLRSPNGGGGDRPRPFIIIAIWAQALCWPKIAEMPLQGLVSAVALVLCIHTGVSELLAHDEWGGSYFLFRKAFSASCERGTEGVVTGRVRSLSSRSGRRLCAGRESRKYRYKRSSQPLRWSCFGEAAVAGLNKGKVHLLVLGKKL